MAASVKALDRLSLKRIQMNHSNIVFFISEIDKYTFMFSLKGKDCELFPLTGVIEIQLMELMPSDQHCLPAVWQWMRNTLVTLIWLSKTRVYHCKLSPLL